MNTSFKVRQNKPKRENIITINNEVGVNNNRNNLKIYMIAIRKLATEHILRQLTFLGTNGLPPSNVLNIDFNCHTIQRAHTPDERMMTEYARNVVFRYPKYVSA